MKSVTFPNGPIKMAGNIHFPKGFSEDRRYVAIVVVHPAGGVKEQTAGLYAAKLADEGFVALAYNASYRRNVPRRLRGHRRRDELGFHTFGNGGEGANGRGQGGTDGDAAIRAAEARRGAGTRLPRGLGVLPHAAAQHPNAPSIVPVHRARLVAYDAFHLAEQLLTQPLWLIAGSKAGSLWFSQDALRRAGSRDKSLHIVEGATHIAMYDTPEYVKEAMDQLVPLYQNAGKASSASNFVGPLSAHPATDVAAAASSA